ncbi:MAG: sporulation protein YqfD, partial [Acetanaerobacterium sp.]
VARAGISIWSITKREEQMCACTVARDYKRLRPYAKRAGVRLRVGSRYGLPFHTRRYENRVGLILGVLLFFSFILAMSQFVWSVEVGGNEDISQFELLKALEDEGIKPGVLKKDINVPAAKQNIMLKLDALSWIAINISGTTVSVEVRERIPEPEMEPVDQPCNIVASRSGQIMSMVVYDGEELVKKGDVVKAGDILVSGIIEGKTGLSILKHSGAKVIAQIQEEKVFEIPLFTETARETGTKRTKRMLTFLNADIPIWFCGPINFDYRLETTQTQLTFLGAKLPIYYKEERHLELVKEKAAVSADDAKKAAAHLIADYEVNELGAEEVISRELSVSREESFYRVTVSLTANADIAQEQEIFTESS